MNFYSYKRIHNMPFALRASEDHHPPVCLEIQVIAVETVFTYDCNIMEIQHLHHTAAAAEILN